MGVQDVIAIGVAAAAALWILRKFTRTLKGESGCGCASKPGAANQPPCSAKPRTGLRRQPLVPLERVGRPDTAKSTDNDAE